MCVGLGCMVGVAFATDSHKKVRAYSIQDNIEIERCVTVFKFSSFYYKFRQNVIQ